jgi:gluconate 2-dehydrogenase alpha chain
MGGDPAGGLDHGQACFPSKDVVIIGLGWTGSILAQQLTDAGLNVVAIERGPWRDTATDFNIGYMQDELRYAIRKDLFLQPAQSKP